MANTFGVANSHALFSRWNYGDPPVAPLIGGAALSGGSWLSTLPLTNMQNRLLAQVAQSTDLALSSTQFLITLDKPRMLQIFALLGHNLSTSAQIRVTGYSDAGLTTVYPNADSGWVDAFPVYAPMSQLAPEDANWLTGKSTLENLDRFPRGSFYLFPNVHNVQYWLVQINDTANTNGYVSIGRLFAAPIVQTSVNFLYDSGFGWASDTAYKRSKGGVKFFNTSPPYRTVGLNFDFLTSSEMYYSFMEMQRRLGKDREFFVCLFPNNLQYRTLFSFQANFESLSQFTWKNYARQAIQFQLTESL